MKQVNIYATSIMPVTTLPHTWSGLTSEAYVVVTTHGYLYALITFLSLMTVLQNFVYLKCDNCTFDMLL